MHNTDWKRNTAVFMGSQAISLFGSALVQYAMLWHITLTTQSGRYATMAIICGFSPTLLLSPFTGVWADRYSRKNLIMLGDALIALCTLILALVFLSGYRHIWLMFLVMGIRSIGTAIQTPCVGAILPDLAPTEQLTRINGLNASLQSLIMLLSPMLSGVLMGAVRLETIFFIDVITAAAAILLLLFFLKMPRRNTETERRPGSYLNELKQGFAYVWRERYLRNFFIFCASLYFLVAPVAFLTPLQVTRTFGPDVWRLTAIEVAFSVGMTVGGLVMAAWGGLKNRVHTMSLAFFVMGALTVWLGLPHYFSLYLTAMALAGLFLPLFGTSSMVLLQERVEPEFMGRVFGVMTMINSSTMPLGMLVFGPLADVVSIEILLIVTGLATSLSALLILYNKPLLAAGERLEPKPEPSGHITF